MKSWKEALHLFANGKFKCFCSEEKDEILWRITGLNRRVGRGITYVRIEDDTCYPVETPLSTITLIARKIKDMTDEELTYMGWERKYANVKYYYFSAPEKLNAEKMLYLLSIGVYPFSQSHFETGEVLDIKLIKQ